MSGSLYVPVEVPANVDVEFKNVTFNGRIDFRNAWYGRVTFQDCDFKGSLGMTGSKHSAMSFWGRTSFSYQGLSIDSECEGVSLILSQSDETTVKNVAPGASGTNGWLNVSIHKSRDVYFDCFANFPVNVLASGTTFSRFNLATPELTSVSFRRCSVTTFALNCKQLKYLELSQSRFEEFELNPDLVISSVKNKISARTLRALAKVYSITDQFESSIKIARVARLAELDESLKAYSQPDRIVGGKTGLIHWHLLFFERFVVIGFFKQFYSVWPVLLCQVVIFLGFALLYVSFGANFDEQIRTIGDGLYNSGVALFSMGGGRKPIGWIKYAVILQGFLGILSNTILAVVLARRYSR